MADSGLPNSAEDQDGIFLLSEILQSVDYALAAEDEHAEGQLYGLFTQCCKCSSDWNLLMTLVVKYRLEALLPIALEATLQLDSIEPLFWEACAKLISEAADSSAAEAAFRRAISLHPFASGLVDAYGSFLLQSGRPSSAAELYESHLEGCASIVAPSQLEPLFLHLAKAYLLSNKNETALEVLLQLSILSPGNSDIAYLMATAFKNLRDYAQAISFYKQAMPQHACPVDVTLDIGDCYNLLNRPDLAALEYEQVLTRDLTAREGELLRLNLAQMYFRIGEHDKSIDLFREVLKADPEHVLAHYFLLISLSVVGRPQVGLMRATAQSLWRSYRKVQDSPDSCTDLPKTAEPSMLANLGNRKYKIGILSAEVRDHVVGYFMTPFLENYDRSRFQVDLLDVYTHHDHRSRYLKGLADSVVELGGLNQIQARQVVRDRGYDIVVDTSGYLHSASLFIMSQRCAPVQCHYIGFHATTGLDNIDYFIGDSETIPEEFSEDFSETLWRLPRPWLARSLSDGVPIAQSTAIHSAPVFGCFSSLHKINRQTLSFWGRALQEVPNSLLIIKDRLSIVPAIQNLIHDELCAYGIDSSRISFLGQTLGWQEHMNHFNLIDIAFDTTPWSGATTAFDTLSMGVPLIGIRGDCTSARMSSSVLKAIGADAWIAETPDQFASIARILADGYKTIRSRKEELQHQVLTSPLYDGVGLARELEACFQEMISSYSKKWRG
jgi:predicted O-linked N-acetylglucosamine transferase (SPINDLY family)